MKSTTNRKVAVFLGDFFWSSIPYDGIRLQEVLDSKGLTVDLLMFEKDIRLNKQFSGEELFKFDIKIFRDNPRLKTMKSWDEFFAASKDYNLIVSSVHIAPKTRYPSNVKTSVRCPIACWDIGGADILTNAKFASYYFVKGKIWKDWLSTVGVDKDAIFVTGTPHYDQYKNVVPLRDFKKKYSLNRQRTILVCPTNPGTRRDMFDKNIFALEKIVAKAESENVDVVVKTYPNDYLFYESEEQYSGVYKRKYSGNTSQCLLLKRRFPSLTIIESQDHFNAIARCDAMLNISSSHVSWETHFTDANSYLVGDFVSPRFQNIVYPDKVYNIQIDNPEKIFEFRKTQKKDNEYIISDDACLNIADAIEDILTYR